MSETLTSAIPAYTVRRVPRGAEGVCLQVHGVAGDVLEVELAPADDADELRLRVYCLTPEAAGWEDLYQGPLRRLELDAKLTCPKCHHRWQPRVTSPVKCAKCGTPRRA